MSEWYGYLQSLPTGTVDLPLFWDQMPNQDDSEDGIEALGWLRGTAVGRILAVQEDGSTLIVRYVAFPSAMDLANDNGTIRMRYAHITTKSLVRFS